MSTQTETKTDAHEPGMTFDVDDRFTTPCACGKAFTSTTPSRAQARQRKHAEDEAKKSGKAETKAAPIARAKVCGCGCGEPLAAKAGGLFRSGHDARFKSMLTKAHADGVKIAHPLTGVMDSPLFIATWLDERRGGGSFWQDKVLAGHKPVPERKPRPANDPVAENRGAARADRVMEMMANRRPVAQDVGIVTLRSGAKHGARVVRRQDENSLQVEFLDGPSRGEKVIVLDGRFKKGK